MEGASRERSGPSLACSVNNASSRFLALLKPLIGRRAGRREQETGGGLIRGRPARIVQSRSRKWHSMCTHRSLPALRGMVHVPSAQIELRPTTLPPPREGAAPLV